MDHGMVAGLRRCHVLGFLERGESFLSVAVDEVATGEIDAVVTNALPWGGRRDGEFFCSFDCFGPV